MVIKEAQATKLIIKDKNKNPGKSEGHWYFKFSLSNIR